MRLTRLVAVCSPRSGTARQNCLAAMITLAALCVLVLNFQATPAGAGPETSEAAAPKSAPPPRVANRPSGATNAGPDGTQTLSDGELNGQIQSAINGSRLALQLHIALLEVGKNRLERLPDYTATFVKHERLDGQDLQEMQTVQLKMRHKPFSVYLKWIEGGEVGQEVLYVDGLNDQKMLVHPGGLKGKLLKQLNLEPTGAMAMAAARHPVTEMGLLALSDLLLSYRQRDLKLAKGVRWEMLGDQKFSERDCYCFIVEYTGRDVEPVYRKSITYIDKELSLPVCVHNYGWPAEGATIEPAALDESTMIEYYGYSDIKFDRRLSDVDFDKGNKDYTFRR